MKSSFHKRSYSWLFYLVLILGIPLSFAIGGLGAVIVVAAVGFAVYPKAFSRSKHEGSQERLRKSSDLTAEVDKNFDRQSGIWPLSENAKQGSSGSQWEPDILSYPDIRISDDEVSEQVGHLLTAAATKRGKTDRNSLYLRPFDSTNKYDYEQSIPRSGSVAGDLVNPSYWGREKSKDLERIYAEGLEEIAPLIAMGRPGEHEGALRIVSEDVEAVWKSKVTKLMNDCCPVFVLPSANDGTVWEMMQAQQLGILSKTIFVMPWEDSVGGKKFDELWEEQRKLLKTKTGIVLPEYFGSGAWFRFYGDWRLRDIIQSNTMSWASSGYNEAQSIKFAREGIRDQIRDLFTGKTDEEDYFLERKKGRKIATSLEGWTKLVKSSRAAGKKRERREGIKGVIGLVVIAGLILAYCARQ